MAARQRDRIVAAGSHGSQPREGSRAFPIPREGLGFRRRAMDDQGRHRRSRPGTRSFRCTVPALFVAWRGGLSGQATVRHALRLWRPPGEIRRQIAAKTGDFAMTDSHSDALVFFGATGDLAYKKIFP